MGVFKNQLIEAEVEVGDRLPVPVTRHVALQDVARDVQHYPKRSALRKARNRVENVRKQDERSFIIGALTGLFIGMSLMLMIRFFEVVA